jgi:putative addiction module component (TIGR02574 family)
MSLEAILDAVRALPPTDQRIVAETILEELGDEGDDLPPTDAEKEHIDRRLAAYRSNPDAVVPLDEAIAHVEAKLDESAAE